MAHFNPSLREAEAVLSLSSRPAYEFQNSQGHTEKPCLKMQEGGKHYFKSSKETSTLHTHSVLPYSIPYALSEDGGEHTGLPCGLALYVI